jgi:hypothetical protein
MKRFVVLLSLFGLLLLTACKKDEGVSVYNAENKKVGIVKVIDENNAQFLSANGDERGRLRGALVRDESGARRGTIVERDGHWVILDAKEDEIGTVEKGTDCYGKGKNVIGRVSEEIDHEAAGAACLLFLLK